MFLCIETTTPVCSVALADEENVIESISESGQTHAERLALLAHRLLTKYNASKRLKAVFLSQGPGSYTGLRIGTAYAKGLCFGYDIPLVAVDTLKAMAQTVAQSQNRSETRLFRPMIDARRMEVYTALFDAKNERLEETEAKVIEENPFKTPLPHSTVVFGTGAEKCMKFLPSETYQYCDYTIAAAHLWATGYGQFIKQEFVPDIAYFEPLYLKNFVVTTSKKRLV